MQLSQRLNHASACTSRKGLAQRPIVAVKNSCCSLQVRGNSRAPLVCSARSGGSVLDNPTITSLPTFEKGTESVGKRPPIYKVLLHNDNYNRREYVVKILIKVVNGFTVDDAVVVMQEAHETGVAMVVACAQEEAERYCEGLRLNGLSSTIEPSS
eukprot:CAMPEP_0202910762 /NCGR_PEP_ID=MMETSP1392-20130828/52969_1 /ASSEMBLY_ACC=CAM_ASM_000868 /TAXON_ID=225041 /ORGANISM="Chlamydomonas chlamydogama, Strain SAG 11-48b" /LENGTH=154 /DNA_ID=CAMNT_0049600979 /DNA_START=179 /DNA_END=643 /DNA_ORIENTATION=-